MLTALPAALSRTVLECLDANSLARLQCAVVAPRNDPDVMADVTEVMDARLAAEQAAFYDNLSQAIVEFLVARLSLPEEARYVDTWMVWLGDGDGYVDILAVSTTSSTAPFTVQYKRFGQAHISRWTEELYQNAGLIHKVREVLLSHILPATSYKAWRASLQKLSVVTVFNMFTTQVRYGNLDPPFNTSASNPFLEAAATRLLAACPGSSSSPPGT